MGAPPGRAGAAFAFDGARGAGYDLLFGGETPTGFLNDTWEYHNGTWSNISKSACRSVCPPAVAYASMAYDPAIRGLILLGGLVGCPKNGCAESVNPSVYRFQNGTWNRTALSPPYPVYSSAVAWDGFDHCLLLFGGGSSLGPLAATWCLNATAGSWTQYAVSPSPPARWGATMTNSSLGFDVLFGGSAGFGLFNDTWTFYNKTWHSVRTGPSGSPPSREYAGLAESPAATVPGTPASGDVVLVGGEGGVGSWNDTWTFRAGVPSGASLPVGGNWTQDLSLPTPPPSYGPSIALDFNASRVILTEGAGPVGPRGLAVTWAYFHLAASLNASAPELNAESTETFTVLAGGGSPPYAFAYSGLPPGCSSSNSATLTCIPNHQVRTNVTVLVTDQKGRSTTSTVPVVVDPFGSRIYLRTEFLGKFYTGYTVDNTFGVDTTIAGRDPISVTGHLGTTGISFVHVSGTLWNATIDMGGITPGVPLVVGANYTNWSLFSVRAVDIVESPAWMQSIYQFPGALAIRAVNTSTGAWNDTYAVTIAMGWSIGNLLAFAIPSPGFAGAYSLIPGTLVKFLFGSDGKVSLHGELSSKPEITIGPVTLAAEIPGIMFSAGVAVTSNFSVVAVAPLRLPHVYTVDWISVSATLKLDADFKTSVPLVGASTPEGGIGISLELGLAPSVSVTLVLGPSNTPGNFLGGLDLVVENLLVDLGIAITVSLQAGITDVFELGGGGTLSLAALFQTQTPHLVGVWLNASVFAYVQLLVFKITWTFWSGTLYQYGGAPPGAHPALARPAVNWTWTLAPRYYNTTDYDRILYQAKASSGPAVENVYPATSVAVGGGAGGATIAYTTDNVQKPERQAIGLEAVSLANPSSPLVRSQLPSIPGSVVFSPALLGLPDGGLRAVFSSVPVASLGGAGPSSIPSYTLETSLEAPGATGWGSPTTITAWGFPISYVLGSCGSDGALAVLNAPVLSPNATTPERLLVFDPASHALQENLSVVGMARVTGYDCVDGIASLADSSGNASFRLASTDAALGIAFPLEAGWNLSEIGWVGGAPTDAVLLYRSASGAEAVIYGPKEGTMIATLPLGQNASTIAAIAAAGGFYVFAGVPNGVRPYFLSPTSSRALPTISVPGLVKFETALASGMIVLVGLGATGNRTEPTENLTLAILPLPTVSPPAAPPTLAARASANIPAILLGALLVALVLAAVLLGRTRGPASGGENPKTAESATQTDGSDPSPPAPPRSTDEPTAPSAPIEPEPGAGDGTTVR